MLTVGELREALSYYTDDTPVLVSAPEDGLIHEWVSVEHVRWSPAERGELPTMPGYGDSVEDAGGEQAPLIKPWGAI